MLLVISAINAHIEQGFRGYVPIHILSPGQFRYTQMNVDTKAKKLAHADLYDEGKSSITLKDAIPVVLGPDNLIVLIDSHHELLAAKQLGNTTAPINVQDDLRMLSKDDFFKHAIQKNYIYPYDILGNIVPIPSIGWYTWELMVDDPNRLFAAITMWKHNEDGSEIRNPNASEDPLCPLWIKKSSEKVRLAFIEFKIGAILYKHGLVFDYTWGTNPNSDILRAFTEKARKILAQALLDGSISSFDLIPGTVK